jgi:putative colanic acid biosynthesis UDP-glucose lipid carrier transferase
MKQYYRLDKLNAENSVVSNKTFFKYFFQSISYLFAFLVNKASTLFFHPRKIIVVGMEPKTAQLINFFRKNKALGYHFKGFFADETHEHPYHQHHLGVIKEIKDYCQKEKIDEIYLFNTPENQDIIEDLAAFADENFIYFRLVGQELAPTPSNEVNAFYIDDIPVMSYRPEPLSSRLNQVAKRIFDIIFSTFALLFLIPFVFPIIALLIKLESKGSIFFIQKRPGIKNRTFGCIKFRTMRSDIVSEKQAQKNDPRITRVGAFLRKTSLDELPQFINVWLGDMSIVGPRPHPVSLNDYFSPLIDDYMIRHFVKPGITGLAQVKGYRGETETIDLMEKRIDHDLEYIQHWSLWWDVKIIFLTVWNILKGEDKAY